MYQPMVTAASGSQYFTMSLTSGANKWASRAVIILQLAAWSAVGIILLQKGVTSLRSTSMDTKNSSQIAMLEEVPPSASSVEMELFQRRSKSETGMQVFRVLADSQWNIDDEESSEIEEKEDSRFWRREESATPRKLRSKTKQNGLSEVRNALTEAVTKTSTESSEEPEISDSASRSSESHLDDQLAASQNFKHVENPAEDVRKKSNHKANSLPDAKEDKSVPELNSPNDNSNNGNQSLRYDSSTERTRSLELTPRELDSMAPIGLVEEVSKENSAETTVRNIAEKGSDAAWESRKRMRLSRLSGGGAAAAVAMVAVGAVMLVLGPAVVILRALDERRQERRFLKLSAQDDLPPTYEQATLMDEAPRYSTLSLNTIHNSQPSVGNNASTSRCGSSNSAVKYTCSAEVV